MKVSGAVIFAKERFKKKVYKGMNDYYLTATPQLNKPLYTKPVLKVGFYIVLLYKMP